MASKRRPRNWQCEDERLFTLDVYILSGPMTPEFIKENKVVCRTIQIRGDQTLANLHHAIFQAFDREEEHMYEFQIGGRRTNDPKARRYSLPELGDGTPSDKPETEGDVTRTTVGSLGLKEGNVFGYWFDFGDDWWHQITVTAIAEKAGRAKYPKVSSRIGQSPPQYIDWDDENDG